MITVVVDKKLNGYSMIFDLEFESEIDAKMAIIALNNSSSINSAKIKDNQKELDIINKKVLK